MADQVPQDALTIPQIAEQLRVNQATVRLWVNEGKLKAHRASPKPQARWWIKPEDLQAMLDHRKRGGGRATPEFESYYEPRADEPGIGLISSLDPSDPDERP
jgi:excisionase family DNA binding protein